MLTDLKLVLAPYRAKTEMMLELMEGEHYAAARAVLPQVRETKQAFEQAFAAYEDGLKEKAAAPEVAPPQEEAAPPAPPEAPAKAE